jgi:hypothetical protein
MIASTTNAPTATPMTMAAVLEWRGGDGGAPFVGFPHEGQETNETCATVLPQ